MHLHLAALCFQIMFLQCCSCVTFLRVVCVGCTYVLIEKNTYFFLFRHELDIKYLISRMSQILENYFRPLSMTITNGFRI